MKYVLSTGYMGWVGLCNKHRSEARRDESYRNPRKERTDGLVVGQGGNETQNEGCIIKHHFEKRLKLLYGRYQRTGQD